MKVSGAKQVHYDSGPNMTPLVDVVMVILIFLMLAGSFGSIEHYMVSSAAIHATGGGGVAPPPGWVPPTLIDIRINGAGAVTLPGSTVAIADVELLTTKLQTLLAQHRSAGEKDIEIVLRPSDGTEWDKLAPIYDAALRAKFDKISFAMTGSR